MLVANETKLAPNVKFKIPKYLSIKYKNVLGNLSTLQLDNACKLGL